MEEPFAGVTLDVHQNRNNNTRTGSAPFIYPEFKGYFADIVWMELNTQEGRFTIASPDNDLFVRLFDFYGINGAKPTPVLPTGDIFFLDRIPPIGTKFGVSTESKCVRWDQPVILNKMNGPIRRTLYFYFRLTKTNYPFIASFWFSLLRALFVPVLFFSGFGSLRYFFFLSFIEQCQLFLSNVPAETICIPSAQKEGMGCSLTPACCFKHTSQCTVPAGRLNWNSNSGRPSVRYIHSLNCRTCNDSLSSFFQHNNETS